MPAERFYTTLPISEHEDVILTDQEFHHLVHVMRIKVGEQVELVNGCGMIGIGEVISLAKREATLKILKLAKEPKPTFELILAQAIPRANRLDFIIEKGTELGMTQLWLFPGEKGERKTLSENQEERAETIAISAMKQSGRLWRPSIKLMPRLQQWSSCPYPSFYGSLDAKSELLANAWQQKKPKQGAVLLIGPESGFNEEETLQMERFGAQGIKLHPNILRTDTAAIVALSLASYCQLEFNH